MNVDELKDCNTDKMDDTYLTEAFKVFDHEGTGFIPVEKLKEELLSRGEHLTEEEVNELLLIGDRNEEGHINYEGEII